MHHRGLLCTLLALSAWLLASCSSTPQPEEDIDLTGDPMSQEAINERVKNLVDRARDSESPERERHLLQAAELLVAQEEFDWARNLLTSIDRQQLDDTAFVRHTELLGQVSIAEGAYYLAQRILTNPRLEQQWQSMEPEQEVALRQLRARLFARLGDIGESVAERMQISSVLADEEAEADNREQLWQTLMSLSREQLQVRADEAEQRQLRGWFELAALSKNNQGNLERQQSQVDQWRQEWSDHPASRALPNDLQLLQTLIDEQPRQIALLLPHEGNLARAAEAVRDGFMAAYYQAQQDQSQLPQIRQYDTGAQNDILSVYENAIAEGAELVIGPLDKEQVQTLYEQDELPVPVLTLNYTDAAAAAEPGYREAPEGLYQFGLAAEDEARQVARRALQDGHRQAMILTPNRNWSERSSQAFAREWRELGGEVAIDSQFPGSGDYSRIIQQTLLIDESQARHQALVRLFGTQLEFEPRRRQDLDMIFLIAQPEQGRQIRPTLAFHYAGDLPIYTTSHIYSGERDSKSNRDLNGVRFNTLPWLMDREFDEKAVLDEHARASAIYSRLHALGVDAYRLYPRLPQLAQIDDARLYGATGSVRMQPGGRLERELVWAHFEGGEAKPLSSAASSKDTREDFTDELQVPKWR